METVVTRRIIYAVAPVALHLTIVATDNAVILASTAIRLLALAVPQSVVRRVARQISFAKIQARVIAVDVRLVSTHVMFSGRLSVVQMGPSVARMDSVVRPMHVAS